MVERKLAGDERGAAADAIVEEFEQVGAFARAEGRNGEVVDHHEIDLGDGGEAFAEAAVGVTEAEFLEQPRRAQVERGQALAAGLMGEGAAEKGLAAAGGAVNEEILAGANPVAAGKAGELAAIESAPSAEVEVLKAGAFLERGQLQQAAQPAILAVDDLALDQQAEALFEGEAVAALWVSCSDSAAAMP